MTGASRDWGGHHGGERQEGSACSCHWHQQGVKVESGNCPKLRPATSAGGGGVVVTYTIIKYIPVMGILNMNFYNNYSIKLTKNKS